MENQLDGFEIVTVAPEDSGLPFKIFLKSSGIKEKDNPPGLWIENESGYMKIGFSTEMPDELKKWIAVNQELLTKHRNGKLSDREALLLLNRISLEK